MILGPELRIAVHGRPAPQGSKRSYGFGRMVESSEYVKPWRADVRSAAEQIVLCDCPDQCGALLPGYPLDGPLVVSMVFTFARPKSHYRTGGNAHLLKDSAPARPQGAPDLSKLIRSTEDALTSAGAWKDDARVVEYRRAAKVWAGSDPDALDVPGAVIRVWPLLALVADEAPKDVTRAVRVRSVLDPANPCTRADVCVLSDECEQYERDCLDAPASVDELRRLREDLAEERREHRATGALQRAAEQRVDELTATVTRLRAELDQANPTTPAPAGTTTKETER